ncbi:MAG: ankyrin repeat domain-containing protein [Armatimonadetes bacterium]|nr:ankyrin repeat domain-containing protein [Armatimonadota bacterium]
MMLKHTAPVLIAMLTLAITGCTLQSAATKGNVARVNNLLNKGADPNATDDQGRTALHCAAGAGHAEVAQMLLARGAQADFEVRDATALHLAAQGGHLSVVKLLLDKGADVNDRDADGATPLCLAAREGDMEVVCELSARGARISGPDITCSALHYAAAGSPEVVEFLIARGARVNALGRLPSGWTAAATALGLPEDLGMTPLQVAALRGNAGTASALLDKGANVNASTLLQMARSGKTYDFGQLMAVHLAAMADAPEVVRVLLERGAQVNAPGPLGKTPLRLARENSETAKLLRSHGGTE